VRDVLAYLEGEEMSYFLSWYQKEFGSWIRYTKMFDTLEQAGLAQLNDLPDGACAPCIESGDPASPYYPKQHKRKHTNAWKPRRYGA
jgi:hypothetical protein